jgi:hypothetical protein
MNLNEEKQSCEEIEIREWMNEILQEKLHEGPLSEILKDGVVLCNLINTVLGNDSFIELKCPSKSALSFFQMENIAYFIEKARIVGVPDSENFQTIDLYENKNMKQVYTCIYSLSRNLYKKGRTDIRVIGPKLVEKVSITFTKEQLDEAKRTVSRQYGSIKETKE